MNNIGKSLFISVTTIIISILLLFIVKNILILVGIEPSIINIRRVAISIVFIIALYLIIKYR